MLWGMSSLEVAEEEGSLGESNPCCYEVLALKTSQISGALHFYNFQTGHTTQLKYKSLHVSHLIRLQRLKLL